MPSADRLIQIYNEACTRAPGAERDRFVAESCGDEIGLRERIVSLLRSHDSAGDFLIEPLFPPAVDMTEKTGDAIGRYKLLEILGEGGCGMVYVAEQTEPVRRRVALKVIKLGMDTKQVMARFEAERQALAMMDSPNIAKVFDAGSTETGRPYFVMELVRGLRITEYCDQNQLSVRERLELFIKVCHAIQHAHQKGVIHRDIKPSNILVTLHDGVPVPKVIDFGVAKATEGRLTEGTVYTQFLHFVGTPAYMSPEQAEMSGLDIDTRSDIYSLGVLLYELLTGQPPFDGEKLMASGLDAMRKTIRETEPTRPSTKLLQTQADHAAKRQSLTSRGANRTPAGQQDSPSGASHSRRDSKLQPQTAIHNDLDWIVMKCLEKNRRRRYDTANGLAADLHRHLSNEPVIARPPSAVYRLGKAFRRNRAAFAAAGAVVVALLVGTILSTWQAREARRARDAAQADRDRARAAQKAESEGRLRLEAEKTVGAYNLYVANINRAGQAWEENNIDRLRQVLEETRSFPDRGFEWYYWQRQAHLNLSTLRGHLEAVRSVAFSPDGLRIVTGSDDKTARGWDTASGRELFKLIGHKSGVNSAAFSPDGQFIVTGSRDHTARVWNVNNQREIFKPLVHKAWINCVAFSRDGLRIATASHDGTARVWDARSGRELLTFHEHTSNVLSVAFSPLGDRIVTGSDDRTARVWDSTTERAILKIEGHSSGVAAVAFSPDGQRILTGSFDQMARVWDAASGTNLLTLAMPGPVGGADFSPDGQRIVTGSWDSTATVWNAVNGDKLLTIRADAKAVMSVAFSPNGERIVTGGGGAVAQIWDASGARESLLLDGRVSPVSTLPAENGFLAIAISPDDKRIATAGGPYDEVSFSSSPGAEAAQLWDSATGQKVRALIGHQSGITSVAFSSNRLWVVTASGDQTARVWKVSTGEQVHKLEGYSNLVSSVVLSPDSRRIFAGGADGTARMWDTAKGRELLSWKAHTAGIRSVAFSPNGQWVATGSWDHTARIWNAVTGKNLRTNESPALAQIQCVAFSPDSTRLVAGGWPRLAIVWDVTTGREICKLIGHLSPVSSVAYSPDGRRIVTGAWGRLAKVWDADTGGELLTLNDHGLRINAVAFSHDGQRIITADWNRTARIWQAARADEVAVWEAEERAAAESQDRWREELAARLRNQAAE